MVIQSKDIIHGGDVVCLGGDADIAETGGADLIGGGIVIIHITVIISERGRLIFVLFRLKMKSKDLKNYLKVILNIISK